MKQGSEEAQSRFYDLTSKAVYRFCFFLCKDQNIAHDLCHDTFIKALTHIKTLKDSKSALGWLFQLAKNGFFDLSKKKKEVALPEKETEVGVNPDYAKWLSVKEVLESFSPEDRMILILADMEGLTYQEVADSLGVTEASIRMKLHRLRQDFIKRYEPSETN